MTYRLPPLTTLRLFEAAARHLSFKQAAAELHVTPSAVSHGVQTLEHWLGARLFARMNRGLSLTAAGAAFLPGVQEGLRVLAIAAEAVPGRRPSGRLSISVAPTFAARWLLPRLPRFQARHPEIEVRLDTQARSIEFPRDGIDLAIRMGAGPSPGLAAVRLVDERLAPVCTPAAADGIAAPADLGRQTLLTVVSVAEEWASWAAAAGIDPIVPARWLAVDSVQLALEAAANGVGVALGRWPLVAGDVAAGRLATVLGPPRACATSYWLVAAPETLGRPEARAFRDWIVGELGLA